jgi:Mg/Co/Ni transporter MgtE
MAEKHKTKYKSPKDLEKSTKLNTRKDIKDYTGDEAHGMVPNLSKGVQPLVVRKYATDVLDDVENMVPKIVDHIYKKVEDGEYSPEHARKVFEKMQLAGTEDYIKKLDRIDHVAITNSLVKPENEETLKESISKLSEEQKEQVIRKYVRNKIAKILRESYVMEQEDATDVVDTPEPADVDVDVDDTRRRGYTRSGSSSRLQYIVTSTDIFFRGRRF